MKDTIDIEKVYETMSGRLYNTSLRIVGCPADAEEIMHDTLLRYWKFSRKDEIMDLPKWLSSICIRKSIDRLREKHRLKGFLEKYEDPVLEDSEKKEMNMTSGASRKHFTDFKTITEPYCPCTYLKDMTIRRYRR